MKKRLKNRVVKSSPLVVATVAVGSSLATILATDVVKKVAAPITDKAAAVISKVVAEAAKPLPELPESERQLPGETPAIPSANSGYVRPSVITGVFNGIEEPDTLLATGTVQSVAVNESMLLTDQIDAMVVSAPDNRPTRLFGGGVV